MHSIAFKKNAVNQFPNDFRRLFWIYRFVSMLRGRRFYGTPIYRLLESYSSSLLRKHNSETIDLHHEGICCRLNLSDQRLFEAASEFFGLHQSTSNFGKLIKHYNTLIDVGANYGTFSLEALKQSTELDIFLFEPNPWLYDCLKYTFENNQFSKKSRFFPYAAGSAEGQIEFFAANNSGLSGQNATWAVTGGNLEAAKVVRIDRKLDYLSGKRILLKVDVEGFEQEVITGCESLIQKNSVDMVLEINIKALESRGESLNNLMLRLVDLGFEGYKRNFDQSNLIPFSSLEPGDFAFNIFIPSKEIPKSN